MELLRELTERGLGLKPRRIGAYKVRRASRAVLFNRRGEVALLFSKRDHYHKLPGGGIEERESIEAALRREVMEETGYTVENVSELGLILEYRNKVRLLAISYGFMAYTKDERQTPELTAKETKAGFTTVWMPLDQAISLMRTEGTGPKTPHQPYLGRFMHARELILLEEARKKHRV